MSNRVTFEAVHDRARGRWPEILEHLGVDPKSLKNRHGPCPGCGGRDRFRFDDKGAGRFFCNGGGEPTSGDGFGLLQHVHGWNAREALERVAEAIGKDGRRPLLIEPRRAPVAVQAPSTWTTRYARSLWRRVNNDDATIAAHPYAKAKGIDWAAGAGRAVAKGSWSVIGTDQDCIVIPIRTVADERLVAVQCITADGKKQTFGSMGDDGCLILGNSLDRSVTWTVTEGWADAVTIAFHAYRGNAVAAVAFGISRMGKVARDVANHYQPERITIMEDAA